MSLATYLSEAKLEKIEGRQLILSYPKSLSFHKEAIDTIKNIQFIQQAILKYLGIELRLKFILQENSSLSAEGQNNNSDEQVPLEEDNDFVNELLDTFNANFYNEG